MVLQVYSNIIDTFHVTSSSIIFNEHLIPIYTICYRCSQLNLYLQPFARYWAETYWGHNTRYVIDHVTIRFPIMGFPIGAPLEPSPHLQAFSRYSAPKCLSNANRHCACAISRDLFPLCKIWVHIWISHPQIAYSLWHFYWAPMKNKGRLLLRPQC